MGMLDGKKGIIFGVANDKSIAWSIAQALDKEGAELAFTYAGEIFEKRVKPLAESLGSKYILPCDVTKDDDIKNVFKVLKDGFGHLDFLVHSIAFAKREELKGKFVDTSRDGYLLAMEVSAYSLIAVTREAKPLMEGRDGSIIALTYYGSQKVIPNYNVMGVAKAALEATVMYLASDLGPDGIRINALSAGPLKTLASAGITGFKEMLRHAKEKAPLGRNTTPEEVGSSALYLISDLSRGVTGHTLYVDCGCHVVGA
ncbi:MAG: enoyl-ACP reductase [Thermodesulfobacteriota bacterium]